MSASSVQDTMGGKEDASRRKINWRWWEKKHTRPPPTPCSLSHAAQFYSCHTCCIINIKLKSDFQLIVRIAITIIYTYLMMMMAFMCNNDNDKPFVANFVTWWSNLTLVVFMYYRGRKAKHGKSENFYDQCVCEVGRDDFFKTFRRTRFRVSVTKRNFPVCMLDFHHVSYIPRQYHLCDRIFLREQKRAIWVLCSSYLIQCVS